MGKDLRRKIKRGAKRLLGMTRMFGNIRYYWIATLPTISKGTDEETRRKGWHQAQDMAKRLRAKGETIRITPRERPYTRKQNLYWDVWRKQH